MAKRSKTDRPVLWLIRQPQGLVPANQFDAEALERYRIGSRLDVFVEQPKDSNLVRLYRGIVGKVAKGIGMDPDSLHWRLRLKAGLFKEARDLDGSMALIPLSTNDLDQAQFAEYFDRATEIIMTEICPGADAESILKETYQYVGIPDDL